MYGMFPKRIAASHLQCSKCSHFCDDDPDIFYCDRDHREFPSLCNEYNTQASYAGLQEDDGEID